MDLNLKKISSLVNLNKIKQNFALVFWLLFLILVIFEFFTIYSSVKIIQAPIDVAPPSNQNKGVRINFDNYNAVVKRIENASSFTPTDTPQQDPFNPTAPSAPSAPAPASPPAAKDSSGVLQLP